MKSDLPFLAINGTNQGGKTTVQCVDIAHYMKGSHPFQPNYDEQTIVVVVNSRAQAATVFGRYFLKESCLHGPAKKTPFFTEDEVDVQWDRTVQPPYPKVITHKETGSEVHMILSGAAKVATRFRGRQIDRCYIDEDACNQELFDEILPRLLVALSDESRPGGGRIIWGVTEVSINEAMSAFMDRCRDPENETHEMFTLLPEDSKAVTQEARDIIASSMSEKARRIRNEGTASAKDFVTIYPCLRDRMRFVRDEPYVPTDKDNYWIAYDPGVDHPSGILIAAQNAAEPYRLNLLRFICQTRMSLSYEIDLIREWLSGRRLSGFIVDPCGGGRTEKGLGKSVKQQIAERIWDSHWWIDKPFFPKPNPRHDAGISLVREYLEPDGGGPPLISVDKPTQDNGLDVFLSQMINYRGNESKHFTGPDGVIKKNDEAPDCIRYLCMVKPRWVDHGVNTGSVSHIEAPQVELSVNEERRRMSKNLSRRHKKKRRSVFG
jgi:hypothetical protein